MDRLNFAGFIMTYNRPGILENTIRTVLDQSLSPEKILIIDNSDNDLTKKLILKLQKEKWPLEYIHTGYNAGPAGAAKLGLKILSDEGFKWIYWGDDDDPPLFPEIFENLLGLAKTNSKVGAIGSVGSKFNFLTGILERFKDEDVEKVMEVNAIGGNHNLIVSGSAVRDSKVFPDESLFFGFEEFDFLQRLKSKGYKILISGDSLLKHRKAKNRLGPQKLHGVLPNKENYSFNRKYYSDRNLIYILFHNLRKPFTTIVVILRLSGKAAFLFLRGFRQGIFNLKLTFLAIYDGLFKRMGHKVK